jgi:hypothetical protein
LHTVWVEQRSLCLDDAWFVLLPLFPSSSNQGSVTDVFLSHSYDRLSWTHRQCRPPNSNHVPHHPPRGSHRLSCSSPSLFSYRAHPSPSPSSPPRTAPTSARRSLPALLFSSEVASTRRVGGLCRRRRGRGGYRGGRRCFCGLYSREYHFISCVVFFVAAFSLACLSRLQPVIRARSPCRKNVESW